MNLPLQGIRVLDLSQLAQGPFATQILGDLGADVIKVEPPKGDWMRRFALVNAFPGGESISFLSFNRNKRSIVINAKDARGIALIRELAREADILVENFRPGVMDRLGLGYDVLSSDNPRLVFCSASGYGQTGPYATRPGQDLLAQSLTGLPFLNGRRDDPPVPVGIGLADLVSGLHIAYGVLAALVQRSVTGLGQRLEVNLMSSLMALQQQEITAHLNGVGVPSRHAVASSAPHVGPPFGIYSTKNGYIALAMNPMEVLGPILGLPDELSKPGINLTGENVELTYSAIAKALLARTTEDWLTRLLEADIWCAQVQDYDALENDPQVAHNHSIITYDHPLAGIVRTVGPPVTFSRSASQVRYPAPLLGEHTIEIATEVAGIAPEEMQVLLDEGVLQCPPS